MVTAYGIELVCFINGDLETVVDAWRRGALSGDAFIMPGRKQRGGRFHNRLFYRQGGKTMNTQSTIGRGQGRGGGGRGAQGRGGQGGTGPGRGRRNNAGATASDACICPKCGHEEAHQRGMPCMNRVCPKCGTALARK
jgi:hypothetical protein